ncbi:hypothetical protein CPB85DRAFT_203133 [Mucidula mucida]|nr:hypothetical protein CPB85DRAFT_203133 [Mucidula mucida]
MTDWVGGRPLLLEKASDVRGRCSCLTEDEKGLGGSASKTTYPAHHVPRGFLSTFAGTLYVLGADVVAVYCLLWRPALPICRFTTLLPRVIAHHQRNPSDFMSISCFAGTDVRFDTPYQDSHSLLGSPWVLLGKVLFLLLTACPWLTSRVLTWCK